MIFMIKVLHESKNLTEEPSLPRIRKVPRRLDDGSSGHVYSSPKDRYRHVYFEALDLASEEVNRRFEQSDIKIMSHFYLKLQMENLYRKFLKTLKVS